MNGHIYIYNGHGIQSHHFMANKSQGKWKQWQTIFSWAPKSPQTVTTSHEVKRHLAPWKKSYDQPRQLIKKQRHYFANRGPSSQSYGFSSSHVWMWELDYKESWALKKWMVLNCGVGDESWESLWLQRDQPVHPKGDQSWILIGRTDVEAETPILWPPDVKNWLTEKDPDAGKDWGQEEKGMTEDEMVGRHHRLNEHEPE